MPLRDWDWSAAIWDEVAEVERKACRRAVKAELKALPQWARGAVPRVILLKTPAITAVALRARCRACGKCADMMD